MIRRRLVLLARWPAPGRCKRRLAQAIGSRRAAAVQAGLLWHGMAAARQAAQAAASGAGELDGAAMEVVLALDGVGARARGRLAARWPVDRLVDQGGGSLGLRLQRQVMRARREGIGHLVLVGSDLPGLCRADLLAAFAALQRREVVLGPAADGGYWLIGLRPRLDVALLFAGAHAPIPWGTERVWEATLEAVARAGWMAALLPERRDLDRAADLAVWR